MPPTRRHRPSLPMSPTGADDISYLTLAEVRDRLARNERVLNSSIFKSPSAAMGGRSSSSATSSPAQSLATSPTSPFLANFSQGSGALQSSSSLSSASPGVGAGASVPGPNGTVKIEPGLENATSAQAGPSRNSQPQSPSPAIPRDPVKEKLLLTRQVLLAREQELLMQENTEQVGRLHVGSPESPSMLYNHDRDRDNRRASGSGSGSASGHGGAMNLTDNGVGAGRSGKARALEIIRQGDAKRSSNAVIL